MKMLNIKIELHEDNELNWPNKEFNLFDSISKEYDEYGKSEENDCE